MEKCFQRDPGNIHTVTNQFGSGCMSLFDVRKFHMQEYMCYRIRARDKTPVSFTRVAHSLFFGNTFYLIVLNPVFNRAYAIMPIVYNG